jgi:predicted acetyltransferase
MATYWLRRDGYPIGMSKLRIRLTKALLELGGHIGFCIRPSERGRRLANVILTQTVEAARMKGLERLLLTCDTENEPSWRTIEACGGKLEKMANLHRYYWIDT